MKRFAAVARSGMFFALCAAWLGAVGCSDKCRAPDGETRPNVVLVTIDTLRADHLGAYGNPTVRTPHLDRLASEGVLFEHAFSQTHITVPSHLSIMSSLPTVEHGVTDNLSPVARPVDVLPEWFKRAGYHTGGFVSASHLGPRRALGQLMGPHLETFEFPRRTSKPWRAEETNAHFFSWLRGGACRGPFFAWIHYWDPHMPYSPPAPYDSAYYDDDPYAERHTSMRDIRQPWAHYDLDHIRHQLAFQAPAVRALKRQFGLRSKQVRQLVLYPVGSHLFDGDGAAGLRGRVRDIGDLLRPLLSFRLGLADFLTGVRDVRFPLARYAGEVSYADAQIGGLRAELQRLGVAGRTLLLVTADHGEMLGEHGVWFEHSTLHDPSVHVPLIVWWPGHLPAARRADVASGLDVAPTLLALAGLKAGEGMRGRDLFGTAPPLTPTITEGLHGDQLSVRDGTWKLIRTIHDTSHAPDAERVAGAVELYDMAADPDERLDVSATNPERRRLLDAALDTWIAAHPAVGRGAAILGDRAEDLKALGYVE